MISSESYWCHFDIGSGARVLRSWVSGFFRELKIQGPFDYGLLRDPTALLRDG